MCLDIPVVTAASLGQIEASHMALAIPIIAIGGGLLTGIIAIISGNIRKAMQTREREETKRELAAYVAEGTMTPETAERMLRSDQKGAWSTPANPKG